MVNKKLASLALAAFTALSFSAQASLITNGSFEDIDPSLCSAAGFNTPQSSCDPAVIAVNDGNTGGWGIFDSLPGWNLLYGNNVEVQGAGALGLTPADGNFYIELDSAFFWEPRPQTNPENSNSAIYQSITGLTAGDWFELTFAYSPRTTNEDDNGLHVFWGSDLNALTTSIVDSIMVAGLPEWRQVTYSLQATSSTMLLGFGAYGDFSRTLANGSTTVNGSGFGMLLDDVRLNAVPAPASIALLGLGLLGLSLRRRK